MDRFWILKKNGNNKKQKRKMLRNKGKVVGNFYKASKSIASMTQNIN